MISIIIPTLNEAARIESVLQGLQSFRRAGAEIIVVDGESSDDTAALAQNFADRIETARRGRASQMNAGAAVAHGEILLFLHADTILPSSARALIESSLSDLAQHWGRFNVRIDSRRPAVRAVAFLMNWRSRLTGIATGDQAMFVRRVTFNRVGGYPEIALMEDIALSKALNKVSRPACVTTPVVTSARKWEADGVLRTIFLMWRLRLAYYFGANPDRLASLYGYALTASASSTRKSRSR